MSWPRLMGSHEHGGAISCREASSARRFFLSRCHWATLAPTTFSRSRSVSRFCSAVAARVRCSSTLAAMAAAFSASRLAASCWRDSGRPSGPRALRSVPPLPREAPERGAPLPAMPPSNSGVPMPPSRSSIPPMRSPSGAKGGDARAGWGLTVAGPPMKAAKSSWAATAEAEAALLGRWLEVSGTSAAGAPKDISSSIAEAPESFIRSFTASEGVCDTWGGPIMPLSRSNSGWLSLLMVGGAMTDAGEESSPKLKRLASCAGGGDAAARGGGGAGAAVPKPKGSCSSCVGTRCVAGGT
mmetsp:Transcript_1678/g.5321  ORF Transcript_1678/g.5321 Transcript_1678/m.5321 type:complete len:298 (+) Transcript_1678:579-1472(+)